MKDNKPCLVTTTINDEKIAKKIAQKLVESKLAACVQIYPVKSYFSWEGKIDELNEFRIDIKTFNTLYPTVEQCIKDTHEYEVPEIIQVAITGGSSDYLDWMMSCLDQDIA